MFYKIGNSRVVHNGSVFVFVLYVLLQFVQNAFTERSQRVRYLCVTYSPCKSMVFAPQKYGFWRAKRGFLHCKSMVFVFECWVVAICSQCYRRPSATFWQTVSNILAIRFQHFGRPSAAVGVRFIVPAYMCSPPILRVFG